MKNKRKEIPFPLAPEMIKQEETNCITTRFKHVNEQPIDELIMFAFFKDIYNNITFHKNKWFCNNPKSQYLNMPEQISFELDNMNNHLIITTKTYQDATKIKKLLTKLNLITIASDV